MVRITSNENPMGPCKEGIEAMARVGPMGWRYNPQGENLEFRVAAPKRMFILPDPKTTPPDVVLLRTFSKI